MAGEFPDKAAPNRARVIRSHVSGRQETIVVDLNDVVKRGPRDKDLPLIANGVVVVAESYFRAVVPCTPGMGFAQAQSVVRRPVLRVSRNGSVQRVPGRVWDLLILARLVALVLLARAGAAAPVEGYRIGPSDILKGRIVGAVLNRFDASAQRYSRR